jgi:hypothetical protein
MARNLSIITEEIARGLCEDPYWDGENFGGIELKAVEILLDCPEIDLGFLSVISEESAEILSKYQGDKIKLGVRALSDRVAAVLARYPGGLELELLEFLSDSEGHLELAKKLAQNGGDQWGLKRIAPQAAEALFAHDRLVCFSGLEELTVGLAQALARFHSGRIYFEKVEQFQVEAILELAAHQGELLLPQVRYVDDRVAWALSEYQGGICEFGLEVILDSPGHLALTEKIAGGGIVPLGDLTTISESAAHVFAAHLNLSAEHIFLGLSNLADSPGQHRVADSIAKTGPNSWVYLDHLESITDEFAEALANRGGWVSLRGLKRLSPGAAVALARLKTINLSSEIKRMIAKVKKSPGGKGSAKKAIAGITAGCPASVFGWLDGGILAVKADPAIVKTVLDAEGLACDAIDLPDGPWSLFNGVGFVHHAPAGSGNLAKFMSVRFGTLAIHLFYDATSGVVGYSVFESGVNVENYADMGGFEAADKDPGVHFESRITSAKPEDFPPLMDGDEAMDCRFIDQRFKELCISLPGELC